MPYQVVLTPADAGTTQVVRIGDNCFRRIGDTDLDPTHGAAQIQARYDTCGECPVACPSDCSECPSTKTLVTTNHPNACYNRTWTLNRTGAATCEWRSGAITCPPIEGPYDAILDCIGSAWGIRIRNADLGVGGTFALDNVPGLGNCPPNGPYTRVGGSGAATIS